MDEMRIQTNFMKSLIAKAIGKAIREKLGVNLNVTLNDIYVCNDDKGAHVTLNVKADMNHDDLAKITAAIME